MKQILCFGDSNTFGLIPGTDKRYPWGVRWTSLLNIDLGLDKFRVIEEGLCGRTTVFDDVLRDGRRGTELLPTLLESHRLLDLVIIMLGTNDCKTRNAVSADVIGKGITHILDQVEQKADTKNVLLISPIHLGDGVWEEGYDEEFSEESVAISKELGSVYQKIAKERKVAFLDASRYAVPSIRDREHMDEAGHQAFAKAVEEKIYELGIA